VLSFLTDSLYLATRYLSHHRAKTLILVISIAIIAFLPIGLNILVTRSGEALMVRAESTPLLLGARGSALELVLSALYFESDPPSSTRYAEVDRVSQSGLAQAIPLHVRFHARGQPIVGTTLEYFDFRALHVAAGRRMAVLGECVIGAAAAHTLGLAPGSTVVSSPESAFDLAGVYPLELQVVGVLAPAHGPDDQAIFVDVKTAWVIEGLGHGHQDLSRDDAQSAVMAREAGRITANASVLEYNRISPENAASFHFHGDLADYPLTAVIAVPPDARARSLLMGRFEGGDEQSQILRPERAMADLLETVFTVRSYFVAGIAIVGLTTISTAALVFYLSFRLRRREIETMAKIGGARPRIAALLGMEVALVLGLGLAVAGVLTLLTLHNGEAVMRAILVAQQ
jgi:putative ABC transport system permease protein